MKNNDRTFRILSLLQVLDAALALACVAYGACMAADYMQLHEQHSDLSTISGVLFIAVIIGSLAAQTCFFLLCSQLKHKQVFVPQNDKALGGVAVACGVSTVLLISIAALHAIFDGSIPSVISDRKPLVSLLFYAMDMILSMPMLLAFLMGSVALIARILQLLMRRAVALQQENNGIV